MTFLTNEDLQDLEQARKEKQQEQAFVLNRRELSYVMRLVAKEQLEKKRKLEAAQKQFEQVNDFFQRLANAHYELEDMFDESVEER